MVNGVVDPLQVGLFARSIASVAAQVELPLWLVELRHAGTHEDLPSVDILRRGTVVVCYPVSAAETADNIRRH
jgi:ribosomal biogenesis protein LAS1